MFICNWGFVMVEKKEIEGVIKKMIWWMINFLVDKVGNVYMFDFVIILIVDSFQKFFGIVGFVFLFVEWVLFGKLVLYLCVVFVSGYDEMNYLLFDFKCSF